MASKKQTTLKDVAAQARVSVVAVSSVLNDSRTGSRVSTATRQRILDAARDLNYFPNSVAQELRGQRTHTIGLLFCTVGPPLIVNAYAASILQGTFAASGEQGYNTLVFATTWTGTHVDVAAIRGQRADGVLLVAPPIGSAIVADVKQLGISTVVVSAPSTDADVPGVDVDNAEGAASAARHLLALGHRRIAHIRGYPGQFSAEERFKAFWKTLNASGVREAPEYVFEETGEGRRVAENMRRLFATAHPPTAIFAANDELALAVVSVAKEMGLAIPDQLSVIGFDDAPAAALLSPPLTTIHHPIVEVAQHAARLLIDQIEGRSVAPAMHRLQPALIVRGSTGPPPPN